MNDISIIPDNVTIIEIINITDESFTNYIIPFHVTDITLRGKLNEFTVPDHVINLDCCDLELTKLNLNDNLLELVSTGNNLKEIILPNNIQFVYIPDNNIRKIKVKNSFTQLTALYIQDNLITDFDIFLPNTMHMFICYNNPGIKIKYLNFLFPDEYGCSMIDHDIDYYLDYKLVYYEHIQARLFGLCQAGCTYIDITKLEDYDYYESMIRVSGSSDS